MSECKHLLNPETCISCEDEMNTEKREKDLIKEELFDKLVKLREKNWSIQDYIEYHNDVVYHSYNIESLKESIKEEE